MKYGDLIQFEPIESVIQLCDADDLGEALLRPDVPRPCIHERLFLRDVLFPDIVVNLVVGFL